MRRLITGSRKEEDAHILSKGFHPFRIMMNDERRKEKGKYFHHELWKQFCRLLRKSVHKTTMKMKERGEETASNSIKFNNILS